MTDTLGITQQAAPSATVLSRPRLVLKPRADQRSRAFDKALPDRQSNTDRQRNTGTATSEKTNTFQRPGMGRAGLAQSVMERTAFDRAALVRAVFHELRMLQNQGAQFVFETRFEGNFSLTPKNTAQNTAQNTAHGAARRAEPPKQANENQAPAAGQSAPVKASPNNTGAQSEHFSFLKLADFLILGSGGKTLLLKLNYKRRTQSQRSLWHARLMTLGHTIAYIECETPLDGRERVRQLMETQGYVPEVQMGKANARAKAQALFG